MHWKSRQIELKIPCLHCKKKLYKIIGLSCSLYFLRAPIWDSFFLTFSAEESEKEIAADEMESEKLDYESKVLLHFCQAEEHLIKTYSALHALSAEVQEKNGQNDIENLEEVSMGNTLTCTHMQTQNCLLSF